ncbi:MAG: tetratricopeptide repeat protein [Kosmotoga sp.]|nr:MAG: tetratricopeptide repeat protein [Kosmotoga sp.]
MKKLIFVILAGLLLSITVFSIEYEEAYQRFVVIRSSQNVEEMGNLIEELENEEKVFEDAKFLTLLADCKREYANWAPEEKKVENYERARELAEQAIEMDPNYGYAYYVAGASIGQLAEFAGIVKSLFMLGDFDHFIGKAMELMPTNNLPFLAMGMRYRDTPWPFRNYGKSEELLLKAINLDPDYINSYYELALLYEKWGKMDKAAEYFQKVLELPLEPEYEAQGKESKEEAEKWLKENGYK